MPDFNNGNVPARPATDPFSAARSLVDHVPKDGPGREVAYIRACGAAAAGLTKREEIAKAAMQGMCGAEGIFNPSFQRAVVNKLGRGEMTPQEIIAALAAEQADALLAELERTGGL